MTASNSDTAGKRLASVWDMQDSMIRLAVINMQHSIKITVAKEHFIFSEFKPVV